MVLLVTNAVYLVNEFAMLESGSNSFPNFRPKVQQVALFAVYQLWRRPRYLCVTLAHWYLSAFSIAAAAKQALDYVYLLLVPLPMLFFIAAYKFTDPQEFKH